MRVHKFRKFTGCLAAALVWWMTAAAPAIVQAQPVPEIDQPLAEVETGSTIYKLDWNPDGQTLAAATSEGLILYDNDLQVMTQLHTGINIYSVSWRPDGTQLAVTQDNAVEIWQWDGSTLSPVTTLAGNNPQINVLWSPDGTRIASVEGLDLDPMSWLGTIKFWEAASWTLTAATAGKYEFLKAFATVNQIAWDPTGAPQVAIGGATLYLDKGEYYVETTGQIRFLDAMTGAQIRVIPLVVNDSPTAVAWHPTGATIAVGSAIGMGLYATATGDYIGPLNTDDEAAVAAWSPDGRYIFGNGSVYDTTESRTLGYFVPPSPYTGPVAVVWSPDGSELATAYTDGSIQVDAAILLPGMEVAPGHSDP